MLNSSNLSFWEIDSYFSQVDYVIIGSGIVGLSTAYHLAEKNPEAKILILEKGALPEGASTKNAGFACFGTLSEILQYLQNNDPDEIYNLVERRYRGLLKLRKLLGDQTIQYQEHGGYELFREQDRAVLEHSLSQMESINQWLHPIFKSDPFQVSTESFGFESVIGQIKTPFEGHIHTGAMMRAFVRLVQSKGVAILNNCEVTNVEEAANKVHIELQDGFSFSAKKLALCTNAFTNKLYDLPVVPARAQVLVTRPLDKVPFQGCFHFDEGFYFFRNTGNRILFGGGRNLDIEGETTTEFGLTDQIQKQLEFYLKTLILPNQPVEIEHRWSGIMGMGPQRTPILKQLSDHVFCGVRLTGTGVAIGTLIGEELAQLMIQ